MGRRIALLTNFVPPYRVPLFRAFRDCVSELRILVSTPMEGNRTWAPDWGDLPVEVERTWSLTSRTRHPAGFDEVNMVHVPISTVARLRRFQPDVVISGELGVRSLMAAFYRRLSRNSRLVLWATVSERSEAGRGALRRSLRHLLVRQADAVIVNGESGARYVAGLGAPADRIIRMPYSMDPRAFQAPAFRHGPAAHTILHVGQLIDRKGIVPLMQALVRRAERAPEQQVRIVFVGDGPLRGYLEQGTWPANLHVDVRGPVSYDSLRQVYGECGLLAFPTLSDEWGMVVNEALTAGLPVLGSIHAQAVDELIRDGGNGWRMDPTDPASLDGAIDRALSTSEGQLDGMRASGQALIAEITPRAMAQRMLQACQVALG